MLDDVPTLPGENIASSGSGPLPPTVAIIENKDEIKLEPVESPGETASISTLPDLADLCFAPESAMLDQIKEILHVSDNKNTAIMVKVADISSSILQVEDRLVDGVANKVDNVTENMAREINIVSVNINDVSVTLTKKIDNVTTNMTTKFEDVEIKLVNNNDKIDEFKGAVATFSGAVSNLHVDTTKHKTTVNKYSDKVSRLEIKVQKHKEETNRIAKKLNTDYIKRKELDNILREKMASSAGDGNTDSDFTSGRGLCLTG